MADMIDTPDLSNMAVIAKNNFSIPANIQKLAAEVTTKLEVDNGTLVEMVAEKLDTDMHDMLEEVVDKLAEALKPMVVQEIIRRYLK